jgi:hypothetical protein
MKLLLGLLLISNLLLSQTPSINILGGNDTAICGNISLNLTCELDTNIRLSSTYIVNPIPYLPNSYNTGNVLPIVTDDVWSNLLPITFPFCFYGQQYNQFVISTNGTISFNNTYANAASPWAFTMPIPTNAFLFPRPMIGLFHDLDPSAGGTIRYGVIGVYPYRKMVISFIDIPHYQCNTRRSTFQIVLHELTNIIDIHVLLKQTCAAWNGGRACLGIQNPTGTIGLSPPGRNTSVFNINTSESWRFLPNSNLPPPQWFINGTLSGMGFLFNTNVSPPSIIRVVQQYNCNNLSIFDAINIDELPCCDELDLIINTN